MGVSARNTAIHLNGNNITGYCDEYDSSDTVDLQEDTRFGPAVEAKKWAPNIVEAALNLGGFWDGTVAAISDLLSGILLASAVNHVTLWFEGDAAGAHGVALATREATKKVTAKLSGLVKLAFDFKAKGTRSETVVSLHSMETTKSAGANGTTVDHGAATTDGSATLHVEVVGAAFSCDIYHSTDNFAANNVLLASFTDNPADLTAERIIISGTINRYTRVVWTQTGDVKFGVGLHRKGT